MLTLDSYEELERRVKLRYGEKERIVCLLLARDSYGDNRVSNYFTQNFKYLNEFMSTSCDIFCPGFSEDERYDFVPTGFAHFIRTFMDNTSWKYDGAAHIIFIHYLNWELKLKDTYDLNLEKLFIDGGYSDYDRFIHKIIVLLSENIKKFDKGLTGMALKMEANDLWNNFKSLLPNYVRNIIKSINCAIEIGNNFTPIDIRKIKN